MKEKTIIECIRAIDRCFCGLDGRQNKQPKTADWIVGDIEIKAGKELEQLSTMTGLNEMQTIILAALVRMSGHYGRMDDEDIAKVIGMDYLEFLCFYDDLEGLKKAGYVKISESTGICISSSAMNCIKHNKPIKPEPITGLDAKALLSRLKSKLDNLRAGDIENEEFMEYMEELLQNNKENSISVACRKYLKNANDLEKLLLYVMIDLFWFDGDDNISWDDLDDFFENNELPFVRNRYKNGALMLLRKNIIEPVADGGIFSRDAFHIKDEVKEEIFKDLGYTAEKKDAKNKISASAMLKASDIDAKELFFSKEQHKQIQTLEDLFEEKRLNNVMESLKKKGMRTGFTCIFYGAPGTGKTESVYQIARKSGRDIFRIDVSKIKSCWVGESEKNIHRVFEQYRECVKSGGKTPILLFNEADAIFGIRQSGAERAVDKMENSIQNIILQEMEELEGILIATTNLTDNFDKAFDRRFLYKLRFTKPDAKVKSKIWKSMIPELKPSQAKKLAAEFDFSGGQIENIARKKTVAALISGKEPTYAQLREMCQAESISGNSESKRKIGY